MLGVQLLDVGVDLREPLGDGGGVPLPAPLRMAADVQHGSQIFLSVTNILEYHKYFDRVGRQISFQTYKHKYVLDVLQLETQHPKISDVVCDGKNIFVFETNIFALLPH